MVCHPGKGAYVARAALPHGRSPRWLASKDCYKEAFGEVTQRDSGVQIIGYLQGEDPTGHKPRAA